MILQIRRTLGANILPSNFKSLLSFHLILGLVNQVGLATLLCEMNTCVLHRDRSSDYPQTLEHLNRCPNKEIRSLFVAVSHGNISYKDKRNNHRLVGVIGGGTPYKIFLAGVVLPLYKIYIFFLRNLRLAISIQNLKNLPMEFTYIFYIYL